MLILLVKLVECGNLPPERRSGVAAKDENYRPTLRGEGRQLDLLALIQFGQREVRSVIADLEGSRSSPQPECLKRQNHECDGSRNLGHHAGKLLRRLSHHAVERAACDDP